MKKLQLIALLLCALLMSMPVAWAQELSVTISGKDRASGAARSKDTLIVDTIASIPGEDIISKEQVRLYYEDSYAFFDNCTRVGESPTYRCLFDDPSFEAYEQLQFRVELRNDDDRVVKSDTKQLKIDGLAPVIKTFNVTPAQTTSEVTIKYAVEDYGLTAGSIQQCSGIKRVVFTQNGRTLTEDSGQGGTCSKERQFNARLNETGPVCAQAFDLLEQSSQKRCVNILVDSSPPDIREPSIINNKGIKVTHIRSDQNTLATVSIRITDQVGVDKQTVQADLSAISPVLKDFKNADLIVGETYTWQNVPIVSTPQCKINVRAKDKLGNSANKEFACSIRVDNTPPSFKAVVSDRTRNNIPLYGRNTALVVEFEDKDNTGAAGIGLNRRQVYLDLSEIGLSKFEQAKTCEQAEGANWRCTWALNPPKNTAEGNYDVFVAAGTSDDLDNVITTAEKGKFTLAYDDSPPLQPKVIDFRIIKGEESSNITGAVAGNFVQYTITSANFTDAFANFTDIGKEKVPGICGLPENESSGLLECMFEQRIELSGPYLATFDFAFTDDAGNKANVSTQLDVFGLDNETRAKYYTAETICTPTLINRATASLIPPYISCRVHLKTPRKDIKTFQIRGPQDSTLCSGDTENVLSDVFTTNANEGSTDPLVIFKLEAKDYNVNSINITCPLSIISKKISAQDRTFISPTAQVIQVPLKLQFYNEPKSDMYNEVDRQIEKAMSDSLANLEWLGTLKQALYYFELLCRVKNIITSLVQALTVVGIAVGVVRDGLLTNPFTAGVGGGVAGVAAALCGTDTAVQTTYQTIVKTLNLFCFFVNCGGEVKGSGGTDPNTGQPEKTRGETVTSLASGGINPLCNKAAETLGLGMPNIKDSLVWSIFCLCLPGIVHNVEKLRQVQCYKAVCLHDEVKERGYPVSYCEEMYQYNLCQFVVGQVFAAIPFAAFANKIMGLVTNLLSNPVALVTVAATIVCMPMCSINYASPAFTACAVVKVLSLVSESVASVVSMSRSKDLFKSTPGNACKRMEKIEKEYAQQKKQRETENTPATGDGK